MAASYISPMHNKKQENFIMSTILKHHNIAWRTSHLQTCTRVSFLLTELLVLTAQYCRKLKTVFASAKTLPLFLKEKGSVREKEVFRCRRAAFSRENKLSFPLASSPFTLIELLVSATC